MTDQVWGVSLQGVDPPDKFQRMVGQIEALGYHHLWLTDSSLHAREVFCYLTLAAEHSQTLRLGTNCTHPHTRHPAVTINGLATVNDISGGRGILGIGAGDSPVEELGKPLAKLAEVEAMIACARRLYAGERFDFDGPHFSLRNGGIHYGLEGVAPPKIYITASGPKMLELAGRIADGVIAHCGTFRQGLEYAIDHVRKGVEIAGRNFADVDFAWQVFGVLDEDLASARDAARPIAASMTRRAPSYCKLAGIPDALTAEIRSVYEGGEFHEAHRAHALTSDKMVDSFTIAGGVSVWEQRLKMARDLGVTHIELFPLGDRIKLYSGLAKALF